MTDRRALFHRICLLASLFTCIVIVLGAYTRLVDGGLGCPDWPGCYGHIGVPQTPELIAKAQADFPGTFVEAPKAWSEMVHRYFAGSLVSFFIFVIISMAVIYRKDAKSQLPFALPMALLGLIIFQVILGMWTVTMKLHPLVVMGHLLGGFTTLCILWWMALGRYQHQLQTTMSSKWLWFSVAAFAMVFLQIALGGWTSSNYAAMACPDFPYCQGRLLPPMQMKQAFNLFHPLGVNYEFGVLSGHVRATINTVHRFWGVVTFAFVGALAVLLYRFGQTTTIKRLALVIGGVLLLQFVLGILNIVLSLPLLIAVSHNAGGALLMLVLLSLVFSLRHGVRSA